MQEEETGLRLSRNIWRGVVKMLSKQMYSDEYIYALQKRTGNDPSLLEKVIYAFGLLEAIRAADLPFCFKGGTSLMLLLDFPKRISTDIDIVVRPGVDIIQYIHKAGKIFPFLDVTEDIRMGKNNIEKRHFKFNYKSPISGRVVVILLDVLIDEIPYKYVIEKPILNDFLLTEGESLTVTVPTVDEILGEKLTAFAPHTTGIPFGISKELEIIKQLFDCATLFNVMTDFSTVKASFNRSVQTEIGYRGISLSSKEVLNDTITACLCIASRGNPKGDYAYYRDGISRIRNHILGGQFSGEIAGCFASKVFYLTVSILTNQEKMKSIANDSSCHGMKSEIENPKRFNYLKIVDPNAYGYLVEGMKLLQTAQS